MRGEPQELLVQHQAAAGRAVGDAEIAEIVARTLEETPPDGTHWSLRSMARAVGYAPSTIHRIWQAFGLQPHRSETSQAVYGSVVCGQGARHRRSLPRACARECRPPRRANAGNCTETACSSFVHGECLTHEIAQCILCGKVIQLAAESLA